MSILINVKISQVDLQKDVKEHKKLLGKWNKQPECGIADATMNDHAMDARMTETLNRLHVRYGYALQKSKYITRRMATTVA